MRLQAECQTGTTQVSSNSLSLGRSVSCSVSGSTKPRRRSSKNNSSSLVKGHPATFSA
ncbi:hypothetical protein DPMN_158632 [Dreissena polymorpha]|uniref:Uncharacterized protein n=1 Tax=Dreissena polymorpha TaxID=45954 RepID=A0A9D4EMN8_DREPO|nr:hypothetical protein DPMN_158632 [Dreissena polymorpha]